MSVSTRHTLLCLFCCGIIGIRFYTTRPPTVTANTRFNATVKINQLPYTRKNKQYLPNDSPYLIISPRFPSYSYGDVIEVRGEITPKLIINNPEMIVLDHHPNPFLNQLYRLRNRFEDALQRNLPSDNAALAEGMLLGTKEEFSEDINTAFQNTGTLHMIVVSGYNITLVISSIMALSGYLHRRMVFFLALSGCLLFILLSGVQPPAVRAGVMATIVLIGRFFGRPADTFRILIISIFLILLFWPQLLISLSFQLSCVATVGILLLPNLFDKLSPKISFFPKSANILKWLRPIKAELVTTLSAQVAVAPLVANTFGTLSLIAPLANLCVAWSVPYIMLSTLIVSLADIIHPMIAKLISVELYGITAYFLQVITLMGRLPYAAITNFKINNEVTIGIYAVMAFIIIRNSDQLMYPDSEEKEKGENE